MNNEIRKQQHSMVVSSQLAPIQDLPPSLASAVLPCEASHKRLNIAGIEVTAGLLALEHCTCALCLGLPVVGRLEETGADESDSVNARGLGDDPLHRSESLWTIS